MMPFMHANEACPMRHAHIAEAVVCPAEFGGIITGILCQRLCRTFACGYQFCQEVAKRATVDWNPELRGLLRSICAVRHLRDVYRITGANDPLILFDQLVEEHTDAHFDADQMMEHLAHGPGLGSRFVIDLGLGEPLDAIEDVLPVGIGEEHGLLQRRVEGHGGQTRSKWLKKKAISTEAVAAASEPWMALRSIFSP
jgi:hypothetical protein